MLNTSTTTAKSNVPVVGDGVSFDDGAVNVGGVDSGLIHAHDRGVVGELASAPLAP